MSEDQRSPARAPDDRARSSESVGSVGSSEDSSEGSSSASDASIEVERIISEMRQTTSGLLRESQSSNRIASRIAELCNDVEMLERMLRIWREPGTAQSCTPTMLAWAKDRYGSSVEFEQEQLDQLLHAHRDDLQLLEHERACRAAAAAAAATGQRSFPAPVLPRQSPASQTTWQRSENAGAASVKDSRLASVRQKDNAFKSASLPASSAIGATARGTAMSREDSDAAFMTTAQDADGRMHAKATPAGALRDDGLRRSATSPAALGGELRRVSAQKRLVAERLDALLGQHTAAFDAVIAEIEQLCSDNEHRAATLASHAALCKFKDAELVAMCYEMQRLDSELLHALDTAGGHSRDSGQAAPASSASLHLAKPVSPQHSVQFQDTDGSKLRPCQKQSQGTQTAAAAPCSTSPTAGAPAECRSKVLLPVIQQQQPTSSRRSDGRGKALAASATTGNETDACGEATEPAAAPLLLRPVCVHEAQVHRLIVETDQLKSEIWRLNDELAQREVEIGGLVARDRKRDEQVRRAVALLEDLNHRPDLRALKAGAADVVPAPRTSPRSKSAAGAAAAATGGGSDLLQQLDAVCECLNAALARPAPGGGFNVTGRESGTGPTGFTEAASGQATLPRSSQQPEAAARLRVGLPDNCRQLSPAKPCSFATVSKSGTSTADAEAQLADTTAQLLRCRAELQAALAAAGAEARQHARQLAEKDSRLADMSRELRRLLNLIEAHRSASAGSCGLATDDRYASAAGTSSAGSRATAARVAGSSSGRGNVGSSAAIAVTVAECESQLSSLTDENRKLKGQIVDLIARLKSVDLSKCVEQQLPVQRALGGSSSWHATSAHSATLSDGVNSSSIAAGGMYAVAGEAGRAHAHLHKSPFFGWSEERKPGANTTTTAAQPSDDPRQRAGALSASSSSAGASESRSSNSIASTERDAAADSRGRDRQDCWRERQRDPGGSDKDERLTLTLDRCRPGRPTSRRAAAGLSADAGTTAPNADKAVSTSAEGVAGVIQLRDKEIASLKATIADLQRQLQARMRTRTPSPPAVRQLQATAGGGTDRRSAATPTAAGLLAIVTEDSAKMKRSLEQAQAEAAAASARLRAKQAKIDGLQSEMKCLQLSAAPQETIDACMAKIRRQELELARLHQQLELATTWQQHQGRKSPSAEPAAGSPRQHQQRTLYARQLEAIVLKHRHDFCAEADRVRELCGKLDRLECHAYDLELAFVAMEDDKRSIFDELERLRADRSSLREQLEQAHAFGRVDRADSERVVRDLEEQLRQAVSDAERQSAVAARREADAAAALDGVQAELQSCIRELERSRLELGHQQAAARAHEDEAARWKGKAEDAQREMRDTEERYRLALRAKAQEVCDVQQQCSELSREAAAARTGTDREVHALRAELAEQRRLNSDVSKQNVALLKLKEEETARLYKDLGCLMAKQESADREHDIAVAQLRGELSSLRSEKEALLVECNEALREKQAEVRRLAGCVELLELELAQLKRSHGDETDRLRADYETRLERCSAEHAAALAAADRDALALRSDVERLSTEARSDAESLAGLRRLLDSAELDRATSSAAEEKARGDCLRLEEALDCERRRRADLESLVARLSDEFDRRTESMERAHADELEAREARIRDLCGRVERIARDRGQLSAELHGALRAKELELSAQVQRSSALEAALRCAQQDHAARLRAKRSEIRRLRDEIRHMGEEGMRLLQLREREITVMKTHLGHLLQLIDKPPSQQRRRHSAASRRSSRGGGGGGGGSGMGRTASVPRSSFMFAAASSAGTVPSDAPAVASTGHSGTMVQSVHHSAVTSAFLSRTVHGADVKGQRISNVDLLLKALPKIVVSAEQKRHK